MQTPCWNDFRPLLWPGVLGLLGTADRRARTALMPKQLPVSVLCLPYALPSLSTDDHIYKIDSQDKFSTLLRIFVKATGFETLSFVCPTHPLLLSTDDQLMPRGASAMLVFERLLHLLNVPYFDASSLLHGYFPACPHIPSLLTLLLQIGLV